MEATGVTVIALVCVFALTLAGCTIVAIIRNEALYRSQRGDDLSLSVDERRKVVRCPQLVAVCECLRSYASSLYHLLKKTERKIIPIKATEEENDLDGEQHNPSDEGGDSGDEEKNKWAEEDVALAKKRSLLPSVDIMQLNRRLLNDKIITATESAKISKMVVKQHCLLLLLCKRSNARGKDSIIKDPEFIKGLVKLARSSVRSTNSGDGTARRGSVAVPPPPLSVGGEGETFDQQAPRSAKTESHWTHAKIRMVSSLSKPRARSKKEDKKMRSRKALSGTTDVGMQLQDADIEV
jgi:hypothetical protein